MYVEKTLEKWRGYEVHFRYMMLSRMKEDCKYYLGNGGRYAGHLWARDEQAQIDLMRGLWESFDEKPEWLTLEDINEFARQMGVN